MSLPERVRSARQPPERADDRAGEMPGYSHRNSESGKGNQQHDLARSCGLIPGISDGHSGKFKMAIADRGCQRHRTPQDGVGRLVILDERLSFERPEITSSAA